MTEVEKRQSKWEKMNLSLVNYQNYISVKPERFSLSLIDLLYISNFKGGNASIHETETKLDNILPFYSQKLKEINKHFSQLTLSKLSEKQLDHLIKIVNEIFDLYENQSTSIHGFKVSFASALLHAYFPQLIPILDRRILEGMKLAQIEDIQKSTGQIKKIRRFFEKVIGAYYLESKKSRLNIRQLDKKYFIN